jgi:hypothetical protein
VTEPEAKAVSKLPKPRDVLLVPQFTGAAAKRIRQNGPRSGRDEVFEQNWLWGQQWQAHDPLNRVVLELPFDAPLSTFELALRIAAVTARNGKDILLLTGHGVAQNGVLSESAFDTLPERGRMATHKHVITSTVLDLPTLADNVNGRWVAKRGPDQKDKQVLVDRLAPRFDVLDRAGAVFKQHQVRSFIVLSCNVGNDTAFQSALAQRLRVPVKMYQGLLAMGGEIFANPREPKVLAWVVPENERANPTRSKPNIQLSDGTFDRTHSQFHNPPPGLRTSSP